MNLSLRFAMIALVVVAAFGPAAASSTAVDGQVWTETCRYVEAGPPGPRGNVLRIEGPTGVLMIHRNGSEIQVFSGILGMKQWREPDFTSQILCEGGTPTVRNIDRIAIRRLGRFDLHLIVNQSGGPLPKDTDPDPDAPGGPLGPGATPEAHGSEIEIGVFDQDHPARGYRRNWVLVLGTPGDDSIAVGQLAGRTTVNFNSKADGDSPDADIWPLPFLEYVSIGGAAGSDRVTGRGDGRLEPLASGMSLWMRGGDGRDVLLGHAGTDRVHGGGGNDLIRGFAGDDDNPGVGLGLTGGRGRDRVYGGPGNDFIGGVNDYTRDWGADWVYGGRGHDDFVGSADHASDLIDCGPGRDGEVQFDGRLDRLRNCELK